MPQHLKTIPNQITRIHYQQQETIVNITADHPRFIEIAKKEINKQRAIIKHYIKKHESFKETLIPFNPSHNAPDIIQQMCTSSERFHVGPMATVAGTIAFHAVTAMKKAGATHAIIDNGGDIALFSNQPVTIGIYTGQQLKDHLALQIKPSSQILGICTSSGWIGHSFSFGTTDATIILSHDISLADAAATAIGNQINHKKDIITAFSLLEKNPDIIGALVFKDSHVGLWGSVPPIIHADVPYHLIAKDEQRWSN